MATATAGPVQRGFHPGLPEAVGSHVLEKPLAALRAYSNRGLQVEEEMEWEPHILMRA